MCDIDMVVKQTNASLKSIITMSASHGGGYQKSYLMGYNTMQSFES
jgi:hypothetical protein